MARPFFVGDEFDFSSIATSAIIGDPLVASVNATKVTMIAEGDTTVTLYGTEGAIEAFNIIVINPSRPASYMPGLGNKVRQLKVKNRIANIAGTVVMTKFASTTTTTTTTAAPVTPLSDNWTALANLPEVRYASTAATAPSVGNQGSIFLFGGETSSGVFPNNVKRYDIETNTWNAVTVSNTLVPREGTSTNITRYGFQQSVYNPTDGKIYLMGGGNLGTQSGGYQNYFNATIVSFDPTTGAFAHPTPTIEGWNNAYGVVEPKLYQDAAIALDVAAQRIYFFAAYVYTEDAIKPFLGYYDIAQNKFVVLKAEAGLHPWRGVKGMGLYGNKLYLYGGRNISNTKSTSMTVYDLDTNTYTTDTTTSVNAGVSIATGDFGPAVQLGKYMYYVRGWNTTSDYRWWQYDMSNNTWSSPGVNHFSGNTTNYIINAAFAIAGGKLYLMGNSNSTATLGNKMFVIAP